MNKGVCIVFCCVEKIFQCAISLLLVLNQRPSQWITIGDMVRYVGISVDIGRGKPHIMIMIMIIWRLKSTTLYDYSTTRGNTRKMVCDVLMYGTGVVLSSPKILISKCYGME